MPLSAPLALRQNVGWAQDDADKRHVVCTNTRQPRLVKGLRPVALPPHLLFIHYPNSQPVAVATAVVNTLIITLSSQSCRLLQVVVSCPFIPPLARESREAAARAGAGCVLFELYEA